MQRLERANFELARADYDRAVRADPAIDRFCSSSTWILAHHDAFQPDAPLHLARDGDAFVALAAVAVPQVGVVLEPLEAMWGFSSPLVGAGSSALFGQLLDDRPLRSLPLLLSGLPAVESRLEALVRVLASRYALRPLRETVRFQASLEGGFDGWLSRRSRSFRRNLRAARTRTRAAGVRFELTSPATERDASAAYVRVLAIERRTWKTRSGNGVVSGPMREFYARMLPELAARGALRVLVASRDDSDLGYLYGAIAGDLFRGLQFSFDEAARGLGLGNALQTEMLERLCAEGIATYDLGSQSDYKRHWAEAGLTTLCLLARPRF